MNFANLIRIIVKKNPDLPLKLKKGNSKLTPFQYIFQTISISVMIFLSFTVIFILLFRTNLNLLLILLLINLAFFPLIYKFFFSLIDVQIVKYARELDADLLFVSEYLLVTLESGLPLPNAIQRLSLVKRPGGYFFKRVFTDFKTGKDFENALDQAIIYAPSNNTKIILKRLKDSLVIGADLKLILSNFVKESSERKFLEIREFSKKLNPLVMIYLLFGIVLPSLGITFFTLGAALISLTPTFLGLILSVIFLFMFAFQYMAYSSLKFSRSTL